MNIKGKKGWLRVWMVASAAWVVLTVGLQMPVYLERHQALRELKLELAANQSLGIYGLSAEFWAERDRDLFWRDARDALMVVGPPLAVPVLILLVLWVSRWVGAGFAHDDRE